LRFFAPVHKFIDESLEKGNNVMVHCLAGAHRAGATGVSYMMKAGHLKYLEARTAAK
jgi:protein-tyrosine phosphatase